MLIIYASGESQICWNWREIFASCQNLWCRAERRSLCWRPFTFTRRALPCDSAATDKSCARNFCDFFVAAQVMSVGREQKVEVVFIRPQNLLPRRRRKMLPIWEAVVFLWPRVRGGFTNFKRLQYIIFLENVIMCTLNSAFPTVYSEGLIII